MSYDTHYTEEEKAAALAALDANGGNLLRTARELNIPESTLRQWRNGEGINQSVSKLREQKSAELAAKMGEIIGQILDVLPGKLEKASARDLAVSLGILIDKKQLLEGQPTQITQDRDAIKAAVQALVERIFQRAVERGETVTRETVIERIALRRPEIKEYLDWPAAEIEQEQ